MSEFESILLYFAVFLISTACFSCYRSTINIIKKAGVSLSVIIPAIFAGLRYEVGTDYANYYYGFSILKRMSLAALFHGSYNLNIEKFFSLISKLLLYVFNEKAIFGIWSGIIVFIYVYTLIHFYPDYDLSIAYFAVLTIFYSASFNILRQEIAISLVFFSIHYVYEDKFKNFIITILIATLIHSSAIVGIIIYFCWNHKTHYSRNLLHNWKTILLILIFLLTWKQLLPKLTFISFVQKFYDAYSSGNQGSNFSFLLKLILLIFFIYFEDALALNDEKMRFFILLFMIGTLLEYTGYYSTFVKRIGLYFSVSEILIFSNIRKIFTKRSEFLVRIIIFTLLYLEFFVLFYILKQSDMIPYKM